MKSVHCKYYMEGAEGEEVFPLKIASEIAYGQVGKKNAFRAVISSPLAQEQNIGTKAKPAVGIEMLFFTKNEIDYVKERRKCRGLSRGQGKKQSCG